MVPLRAQRATRRLTPVQSWIPYGYSGTSVPLIGMTFIHGRDARIARTSTKSARRWNEWARRGYCRLLLTLSPRQQGARPPTGGLSLLRGLGPACRP